MKVWNTAPVKVRIISENSEKFLRNLTVGNFDERTAELVVGQINIRQDCI